MLWDLFCPYNSPDFLPAYMAMFLAMGLGTSAAKTSFFGSLQAVVCAGADSMPLLTGG